MIPDPYANNPVAKAYDAKLADAMLATDMRRERDKILATTDWYGASDVVMPPAIKAWRQAMRDITLDPAFPHVSFPKKPVL